MSEEVAARFTEHNHGDETPDVLHKNPYDRSGIFVWLFEDAAQNGNVLTQDGISQIAHHKYKAGKYTHLDNALNPFWTYCTEIFLPMSMAPNMVTMLGGLVCFLSYMATWYYLPQFELRDGDDDTPKFLLLFNALATALYYTLDCMDGKQARRTETSSPLGQLFDHGIDCFSNLTHLSTAQSFLLMGPSRHYLLSQVGLQVVFFVTQWEEYYTGTLPHAYGKWLGVTEMNYGLALATLANMLVDTTEFYNQSVQQLLYPVIPISLLPDNPNDPSIFVNILNSLLSLKLKIFILVAWTSLAASIVFGCMVRVAEHIKSPTRTMLAFTKLLSPLTVAAMILKVLPQEAIQQECRFVSVAAGLCYCFITIKMIVFSMARMTYASIQMDVAPLIAVCAFVTWEYQYAEYRRLRPLGLSLLFQVLSFYYSTRLLIWTHTAIRQLCAKLDVWLLAIKPKQK